MWKIISVVLFWPLYLFPREGRGVCEGKSIEMEVQGGADSVTRGLSDACVVVVCGGNCPGL